jgi:pilus assembly protein CpaF
LSQRGFCAAQAFLNPHSQLLGDLPAVTIRDLLRATLRHRPDRIIVGEVRGGEAFDLLQALNTGHAGTLSTIHANSAEQALARFASCCVQSGVELPYQAVRYQIADAIDFVLHLGRHHGQRVVEELITVERYDVQRDGYDTVVLFDSSGASADGGAASSGGHR